MMELKNRLTIGLINLSNFGGFRVKSSPTYVTLVTIRFHDFPDTNKMKEMNLYEGFEAS